MCQLIALACNNNLAFLVRNGPRQRQQGICDMLDCCFVLIFMLMVTCEKGIFIALEELYANK